MKKKKQKRNAICKNIFISFEMQFLENRSKKILKVKCFLSNYCLGCHHTSLLYIIITIINDVSFIELWQNFNTNFCFLNMTIILIVQKFAYKFLYLKKVINFEFKPSIFFVHLLTLTF